MSAYGADESQLLGHLDVSKSDADWSSLILCPPRYSSEVQDKYLSFSGTPNLAFTVQIDCSLEEIKLSQPKTVELSPWIRVGLFQFIPTEDISDTQLDVTVTSESADVPAYLKVSRDCKDVKDNIDDVDYKGQSLRLSFAKKGRITLSKVSVPPLTDSTTRWFIGFAIKNASGNTPTYATKKVTLELSKSFDYSYAFPIFSLVAVSIASGLGVSAYAICCFKKELESTNTENTVEERKEIHEEQSQQPSTSVTETTPLVSHQEPKTCCHDVLSVLSNWFTRGPTTYSHTTGIVGFVLMIGAGQFVFANWHLMKEEGDRDNCYYNDFCYRVSGSPLPDADIPFNLMISNLVYVIHGLILAGSVLYMKLRLQKKRKRKYLPQNQAFSIGYAFAWALIFEGGFSLVYHLCPSKLTFQFDTAFMFVIAGLTVILLYNGIEMKECSGDAAKSPVGAGKFFLYFLVPLFVFNYLGTLRHSETGLPTPLKYVFFIVLAIWWLIISIVAGCKLGVVFSKEYFKGEPCKILWIFLGVFAPVICFIGSMNNLPQAFLFACIAESVIASLGTGFCQGIKFECSTLGTCFCRDITFECSCMDTGFYRGLKFSCSCKGTDSSQGRKCKCSCLSFFQILYVLLMVSIWSLALYFFLLKQTTDKVRTPETSRNLNHDCVLLEFFDYHDIWHFLSSHGLLMMVYFVMFLSSE